MKAFQLLSFKVLLVTATVEPVLTHTSRWKAWAMGYEGLWVNTGLLKISSINHE